MIDISINGTSHSVKQDTLATVLTELNYLQKWSAVEVDGEILQKDELETRVLKEGEMIEVITPVGGGA